MSWAVMRENVGGLAKTTDGVLVAIARLGEGGVAWWRGNAWDELPNIQGLTDALATPARLYGIHGDQRHEVVEISLEGRELPIGEGFVNLMGGRGDYLADGFYLPNLYAISTANGHLNVYRGHGAWEPIGLDIEQVALVRSGGTDDVTLFGLTRDHRSVLRYEGEPYAWTRVGGAHTSIASASDGYLIAARSNGMIHRFHVATERWIEEAVPAGAPSSFRRFSTYQVSPWVAWGGDSYCLLPPDGPGAGAQLWARRPPVGQSQMNAVRPFAWRQLTTDVRAAVPMFDTQGGATVAVLATDGRLSIFSRPRPSVVAETLPTLPAMELFRYDFRAQGGEGGPYVIVSISGVLPPGTELANGVLMGRPAYAGSFGVRVVAYDVAGTPSQPQAFNILVGPPRPAPAPPPAAPIHPLGFSRVAVFNCRSGASLEHPPVALYLRNASTGATWRSLGDMSTSFDDSGLCPGLGAKPLFVDLANGVNELLAVDSTLYYCDGDPNNSFCNGGYQVFLGDLAGATGQWYLPY